MRNTTIKVHTCIIYIICLFACGCATSKVGKRVEKAAEIGDKPWVSEPFIEPIASGKKYNPNNALTLARVCRLVWETDRIKMKEVSRYWKGQFLFGDLPDTDSQYLIFGNQNYTVVSFRATQSKAGDLWTVLKYKAYETNPGYQSEKTKNAYLNIPEGNAGFRESAADCFASGLVEDLRLFRKGTRAEKSPLFITGHSLGAGVALLARPRLKTAGFNVDSVYLFGAPVAVSPYLTKGAISTPVSDYKRDFGSTTFFHRHDGDNVPRLRLGNEMYSPPGLSRQLAPDGTLSDYQEYRTLNVLTTAAWCVPWLTGNHSQS